MKIVRYLDTDCVVKKGFYGNGRTALSLMDAITGACVGIATVNLSQHELAPNYVHISNTCENYGVLKVLVDAGIVRDTGYSHPSGYEQFKLVEIIDPEFIHEVPT